MSQALHMTLISPEQATRAVSAQLVPFCRSLWQQGERVTLVAQPEEDAKTVQQGRFLWGVVYKEVSEQASIGGQKYSAEAWHELCKRQFLPRRKKLVRVAGKKRPVVTTTIGTTQGIGIRKMSAFIEQVIAFGVNDLGVIFSETKWENYRP
jgi:hypothetical protein